MGHYTINGKDAKNFIHMKGEVRTVQPLLLKARIIITITNCAVKGRGRLKICIVKCIKYTGNR